MFLRAELDGAVSADKRLKIFTDDDQVKLMRQNEREMAAVMSEINKNKPDHSSLDI